MIYNGEELNIIEMLIEQEIIEDPKSKGTVQENTNTIVEGNNAVTTSFENITTNTAVENIV